MGPTAPSDFNCQEKSQGDAEHRVRNLNNDRLIYFYLYILTFLLLLFRWLEWIFFSFFFCWSRDWWRNQYTQTTLYLFQKQMMEYKRKICAVDDDEVLLTITYCCITGWETTDEPWWSSNSASPVIPNNNNKPFHLLLLLYVSPFFTVIFLLYIEIRQHITPSGDDMIYSLPLLFELIS